MIIQPVITYIDLVRKLFRSHFTGGTGVTINGDPVSIGQDLDFLSNVTFNDLVVSGTLQLTELQPM